MVAVNLDFSVWERLANDRYKRRMDFLNQYSKMHGISTAFSSYISTLYYYLFLSERLFPTQLKNINTNNIPPDYISSLNLLNSQFSCDSCLNNIGYKMAAHAFQSFAGRRFKGEEQFFDLMYDTTANLFRGETRRFMLFSLLKKKLHNSSAEFYTTRLDKFLHEKNDRYSAYLARRVANIKNVSKLSANANNNLIDSNGNPLSWNSLLSDNRGKVLLIDFWASWCIPCRKQLKFSKKLKEELAGKNIKFIYISTDDNTEKWKNAVNQEDIADSLSFKILHSFAQSPLLKQFHIATIPRYIVVSKDGVILDDDAPYPSDTRLSAYLKKRVF